MQGFYPGSDMDPEFSEGYPEPGLFPEDLGLPDIPFFIL